MKCLDPEELTAYHHGFLPEPVCAEIRKHVEACSVCRNELDHLLLLDLDEVASGDDPKDEGGEMPESLWLRIEEAINRPAVSLKIRVGERTSVTGMVTRAKKDKGENASVFLEPVLSGVRGGTGSRCHQAEDSNPVTASRFRSGTIEGTIIVKRKEVKIYLNRGKVPIKEIPVWLVGGSKKAVRYSSEVGAVVFKPVSPGDYVVHIFNCGKRADL